MPYCAYLRKSRADAEAEARGEGETLARHRAILTQLAARDGRALEAVYQEVVSGETIASRPQMQRLLADVAAGRWEGVYVMEVERLARGDTIDQGRVAQTFQYSGAKIITPLKTYDPANEFDEEYFEFGLFMSRREYKTINRRIQAGRMQSVKEGKYICSRPAYGYRKIKLKADKGYSLQIHEEEAAVVRQIFHWYLHGDAEGREMGLTRISGRLQDLRVPPGQQGSGWAPCRVHRILTNEVYTGRIRWGYVKTTRELTAQGIAKGKRMSKDYQLHDGLHPAIIDEATFQAVQEKLHSRHTPLQKNKRLTNPLSGLLYCKRCGHAMRGKPATGRQGAMLYCATHGCPTVRNAMAPLEAAILDTLAKWLEQVQSDPDRFSPVLEPGNDVDVSQLVRQALDAQRAEREALLRQKSALHDLLERGVYDADTFQSRLEELLGRLHASDTAIRALEAQLPTQPRYCDMRELAPHIHHVLDVYTTTTDAAEKNRLLRQVISRVEYSKEIRGVRGVNPNQFFLDVYPRAR